MPDISMCENQKCPSRKSCYRYTSKPNPYRQTYSLFEVNEGEDKCESYWDNNTDNSTSFSKFRVYNENEDVA